MDAINNLTVSVQTTPISVYKDIDSWILDIKKKVAGDILKNVNAATDHLDRYIACAESAEIEGLFIACSFYQRDINAALTRAGLFMGAAKGVPAGTVVGRDDHTPANYQKLVAGHNLPGTTIAEFISGVARTADPVRHLGDEENSFFQAFLESPRVRSLGRRYYLIGLSVQSTKSQASIVSHEIYHAHYYLNLRYRAVVDEFWVNEVTPADKKKISEDIGRAYNVEDEALLIDEFQAYLIQDRAEFDLAKAFVPKYRDALRSQLLDLGIDFFSHQS